MSVSHSPLPGPLPAFGSRSDPARHTSARAAESSSKSMIRLPSYKELTATCGEITPPPNKAGRSSLFTAGLVHLPPLKVPTSPSQRAPSKRPFFEEDEPDRKYLDLSSHLPLSSRRPRPSSPQSTDSITSASSSSPSTRAAPWPESMASHPHPQHPFRANPYVVTTNPSPSLSSETLPSPSSLGYDIQPRLKFSHAKAGGRTKKQALSCYFCRERKIACGRPDDGSMDGTCNQCARRKIECRYPTVSHRGQHSRIKSAARKHAGGPGLGMGGLPPPAHGQHEMGGMGIGRGNSMGMGMSVS
ncbi:hypothetical protein R3P38DRAFT_2902047 [Favolaschia claudopus]|uniref:Zn(2)-C6 fungal-type domain-containing protein n=1 Tax=Favolaschia claudopus TaxID=2862362 RepID=A0AAW0CNV3_9AGAR